MEFEQLKRFLEPIYPTELGETGSGPPKVGFVAKIRARITAARHGIATGNTLTALL